MSGTVFLVGAGPGDPGLMTMKAVECLGTADVVVYDRLADKRILQYAAENVEKIYVGKASNRHTMTQEKICQLLVDLAMEGKTVVRLKGGDPFVFGRGGEEALLLQENGIRFEIVPGVTSAVSVPAYAGIPVTHRGIAASFAVVTGHEDPAKEHSDINWPQLATATDTLVFLMGIANLPGITAKLIEYGRNPDTPVAVIRWGTKPQQQVWTTILSDAAQMVERENIKPPCIFMVGNVVSLRDKLAWFDNPAMRPLFGRRILVTRARPQASRLMEALEFLGAECVEAPAIKIEEPADAYGMIDRAIEEIAGYDWIVFTSTNGVKHFWNRLQAKELDARALGKNKICAIGTATAEELAVHGLVADIIPERYQAEGIIDAMQKEVGPGSRVLIPRAAEAREVLPDALREKGAIVDVIPVYNTVIGDMESDNIRELLIEGKIDVITFTSSSTVVNLLKLIDSRDLIQSACIAAIGPVTANTLTKYGLKADIVAEEYTISGLVDAIKEAFI
ncbi:MAG: uroporphyrinogen-III C-methyltransferase [Anaerovibrio sp.]|uniref:uroporphyrinogen-III C-methyltransferase n=1 Tax=Anaerovibrio sp. TaxID=1872532 RepID=UPI0025CD334A|nr:uroporphyrinogen-III C-methyltransferase [Anaerovibrio sp.]MCR5176533.1 uroporphyrinogen-III C-methyltransferase [Anaerovibrio sp.]